jgi:hypothetical protein
MLKRWLDGKFSKIQAEEALKFLQMLKGANSEVVAEVAAKAMLTAAIFKEQTGYNLYEVAFWVDGFPSAAAKLGAEVKQFQREGRPEHAVGFMVWLHTTRAAAFPELKAVARQIWDELERAEPGHEAFRRVEKASEIGGLNLQIRPGQRPVDFERL